ncbi:MAG: TRAP transporter large permease [Planctomycetota bacterium]
MDAPIIVLVVVFVVLLCMNVPIAIAIGLATLWAIGAAGDVSGVDIVAPRLGTGIDSFALLCIPFFILMGQLLGRGGVATRLIDFAEAVVGRFPGGLAFVNTLACMFFGAISGSAAAAVSSVGGVMIPEMNRKGYGKNFNIALSSCAATTGLLIPPSNVMIVYALVTGSVSVAALFLAGILPGVLMGGCLMLAAAVISRRNNYGAGKRVGLGETVIRFWRALPGLLLIFIVLGGIVSGMFTPTEAASIAVVYAFILSVVIYREVKLRDLPRVLLKTGTTTAVVMLLIGASMGMSWFMAFENMPELVSGAISSVASNKIGILLMINVLLLAVGTFMDMTPAILIFTPIFLPLVTRVGVDPVHFGMIMIANLCIGLCTPPVGTVLFLGVGVGQGKIHEVIKSFIPFFFMMIVALIIITYVPAVSLVLPRLFGL